MNSKKKLKLLINFNDIAYHLLHNQTIKTGITNEQMNLNIPAVNNT